MASLNKVFLLGNLTRDPDLRSLPSGQTVCELGLAVNRRFMTTSGESEETCFVDIVVWGKAAENCKQYLEKGSQVLVTGRLQYDQWEDRNGGGKRSRLRVVAEQVQFMSRRGGGEQGGGYQQQGGGYEESGEPTFSGAPRQSYGQQSGGYQQQGGGYNSSRPQQMPRYQQNQPPQQQGGGMPRREGGAPPPQREMPPLPPEGGSFHTEEEDDIPF